MKTVFTYAHVKWFYGQSERAYYLNYFIIFIPDSKMFLEPSCLLPSRQGNLWGGDLFEKLHLREPVGSIHPEM